MAFTQQTFAGASIRSFSGNIGWGASPSKLTIQLVEDASNGDSFSISIGAPAIFVYDNWSFGGIVKSFTQNGSSSGNPLYTVILEDPRSVLDGTELILNNYNGSVFGVPNLLNVFGYLENIGGFGGANVTDAGIPWKNVRDAVVSLTSGANNTFGNNIELGSFSYEINLSQLPILPDIYMVPAQDISLANFISTICGDANHEYYYTLSTIGAVNTIKLHTIDRNIQPIFGAITDFINSTPGAVGKNVGLEFRDETTSKFLVGGSLQEIFHNSLDRENADFDDGASVNIWPYWGTYANGDLAIGNGADNDHTILLDARWVDAWQFDDYPTDVGELRAALGGQSSWQTYLWLNNFNIFKEDFSGDRAATYRDPELEVTQEECKLYRILTSDYNGQKAGDVFGEVDDHFNSIAGLVITPIRELIPAVPGTTKNDCAKWKILFSSNPQSKPGHTSNTWYKHDNKLNPHFGKASTLKIGASARATMVAFLSGHTTANSLKNMRADAISAFDKAARKGNAKNSVDKAKEKSLFEFVKAYAAEYYGKKFMVRIPFVLSSTDSSTGIVTLSRETSEGGFLDETLFASFSDFLPPDIDRFSLQDSRITGYVKYNNSKDYDFGDISVDNISYNTDQETAFIKVDIDPDIRFLDKSLLFSPRAIVTLPGIVRVATGKDTNDYTGVLKEFLLNRFRQIGQSLTVAQASTAAFFKKHNSDPLRYDNAGIAVIPDNADVPLKSNIDRYGPWFTSGAKGKIDFEQDDSLVPWNYAGFAALDNAANARVVSAISNVQVSEAGNIEFPGTPSINLGSSLHANGPYITDINVQISTQGVTTTYQMKTWTPQPFRLRKDQAEATTRSAIKAQRIRRESRTANKLAVAQARVSALKVSRAALLEGGAKQDKSNTTHTMITGEIFDVYDGSGVITNKKTATVGIQPHYNLSTELSSDNYINKAGISLDGIFQPFAVDGSGKLPSMQTPASGATVPTLTELSPYSKSSNFSAVIGGDEVRDISNLAREDQIFDDARSIALRGPVIIAGYGYTTKDKPIPADPLDDTAFIADVNKRPDQWKVGPLDTRWDDDRKLWVASGSGTCSPQNAKLQITLFGRPSVGDFSIALIVNSVTENIVINFDDTSALIKTAIETHSEVAVDDIIVTGGPLPHSNIEIEFINNLANTNISIPLVNASNLSDGDGVFIVLSQLGIE